MEDRPKQSYPEATCGIAAREMTTKERLEHRAKQLRAAAHNLEQLADALPTGRVDPAVERTLSNVLTSGLTEYPRW